MACEKFCQLGVCFLSDPWNLVSFRLVDEQIILFQIVRYGVVEKRRFTARMWRRFRCAVYRSLHRLYLGGKLSTVRRVELLERWLADALADDGQDDGVVGAVLPALLPMAEKIWGEQRICSSESNVESVFPPSLSF